MNVMSIAHKMTREFFKRVPSSKMSYRGIFKENLVAAHKKYKAMCESMQTAFRNLYRFTCLDTKNVVAFITARNLQQAIDIYKAKGGKVLTTLGEQVSHGYPSDMCEIYR